MKSKSKLWKGEDIMCVGQKIKVYLEEKGISQTYVSNKTNIPMPKLNLALNGNRRMTFDEYELICGVLDVNTDRFLHPKKPQIA
jgi:transcriptional regulator with XRE-family HTH domain